MLSQTSQLRAQVEEARVDLLKWIRKRWMGVRQEGGFDALEGWSIKEISQGAVYVQNFIHSLHVLIHHFPLLIPNHLQPARRNFSRDRSSCRRSYLPRTTSHPPKSSFISCSPPILDPRVRRCRLRYTLSPLSPCFSPLAYHSYLKVPRPG